MNWEKVKKNSYLSKGLSIDIKDQISFKESPFKNINLEKIYEDPSYISYWV